MCFVADATLAGITSLLQETANQRGRARAAKALGKIAGSHDFSAAAAAAALPLLFSLLQDASNNDGRAQAAFAIGALAARSKFHSIVSQAAVPVLAGLRKDTPPLNGQSRAAMVFASTAVEKCLRDCLAEAALPALVALLQGTTLQAGRPGAALEHGSAPMPGLFALVQEDCVDPVARLYAAHALVAMADNEPLQLRISDAAMPLLVTLLQDMSDDECKTKAVTAIVVAGVTAATSITYPGEPAHMTQMSVCETNAMLDKPPCLYPQSINLHLMGISMML